jgi:hypothetical protein
MQVKKKQKKIMTNISIFFLFYFLLLNWSSIFSQNFFKTDTLSVIRYYDVNNILFLEEYFSKNHLDSIFFINNSLKTKVSDNIFVDQSASPKNLDSLNIFINENLFLPQNIGCIEGFVVVCFIVDTSGVIKNTKVVRTINECDVCSNLAIEITNKFPVWNPAIKNSIKVPVYVYYLINFGLQD